MIDHFTALIKNALVGLDAPTSRARQTVYDNARSALHMRIRDTKPPLTPADITRQRLALEDAIRKVEREFNRIGMAAFAPDRMSRETPTTGKTGTRVAKGSQVNKASSAPRTSRASKKKQPEPAPSPDTLRPAASPKQPQPTNTLGKKTNSPTPRQTAPVTTGDGDHWQHDTNPKGRSAEHVNTPAQRAPTTPDTVQRTSHLAKTTKRTVGESGPAAHVRPLRTPANRPTPDAAHPPHSRNSSPDKARPGQTSQTSQTSQTPPQQVADLETRIKAALNWPANGEDETAGRPRGTETTSNTPRNPNQSGLAKRTPNPTGDKADHQSSSGAPSMIAKAAARVRRTGDGKPLKPDPQDHRLRPRSRHPSAPRSAPREGAQDNEKRAPLSNDSRTRDIPIGSLAQPTGTLPPLRPRKTQNARATSTPPEAGTDSHTADNKQPAGNRNAQAAARRNAQAKTAKAPAGTNPDPDARPVAANKSTARPEAGRETALTTRLDTVDPQTQLSLAKSKRKNSFRVLTAVVACALIALVAALVWRSGAFDPLLADNPTAVPGSTGHDTAQGTAADQDPTATVTAANSKPPVADVATAPRAVDTVKINPAGQGPDTQTTAAITQSQVSAPVTEVTRVTPPVATTASRAILYEPNESADLNQQKRYIEHEGSVTWSLVSEQDNGENVDVLRALVNIPSKRMRLALSIRKSTGENMTTSHVVRLDFDLPKDFAHGSVAEVVRVFTKARLKDSSTPLFSTPMVTLLDGHFLMVLSAIAEDHERNIAMLRANNWFDIPMIYKDKQRAFLSIEKGTAGTTALEAALAAWQ